jgi:hypothetical protein
MTRLSPRSCISAHSPRSPRKSASCGASCRRLSKWTTNSPSAPSSFSRCSRTKRPRACTWKHAAGLKGRSARSARRATASPRGKAASTAAPVRQRVHVPAQRGQREAPHLRAPERPDRRIRQASHHLQGIDRMKRKVPDVLDRVADKVLAHRAPARTTKAKKRQRARRKAQRESSI